MTHIEALNERTFEHLYPELTEDQRCDAALARDLLQMDEECIELDSWPAARNFIQRVLIRHDLMDGDSERIEAEIAPDPGRRAVGDLWCAECGTRKGPFVVAEETEVCLACHELLDKAEREAEVFSAREDLGPDASPDTVRWLVEQRANIAQAEHSREE